ncbi:MAG: phosphate uptake regulator PhoU [Nitrososphaerales archaeon]|jgi:phosphate uptake regulator
MDARKVLEMGGGTVLISLPKSWAKRNGVVKGGSVLVEELSPSRLMVTPMSGEPKPKATVIGYPGENLSHVINDITGAYLIGSDIIKVEGTQTISREDRERIKAVLQRLVGLEIMDEDSKSLTLQFLPETSALDPEKIVRRMGSLTRGMLRDAAEALAKEDRKMLSLIAERDDEVDRLYFLIVRAIRTATIDLEVSRRYNLSPVECLDYRVLASFIEGLGDTITEFSARASQEPPGTRAAAEICLVLGVLERMEETSLRIFLGRKTGQGRKTYLQVDEMHREVTDRLRKIAQEGSISTRAIVDLLGMLERISKVSVDISDLSLPTYQFNEVPTVESREAAAR